MNVRTVLSIVLLLAVSSLALAGDGDLVEYPNVALRLKIQQYSGTNGSAVVYNPELGVYHTAFAGNGEYPFETFGTSGVRLGGGNTMVDLRGMWWNTKSGRLEANGYADRGIVELGLDSRGQGVGSVNNIHSGSGHQPSEHSVGTFDGKKHIVYYDEQQVHFYDVKSGKKKKELFLSIPVPSDHISAYSMIWTGQKKMEVGLLDVVNSRVYLFDRKTGRQTATVHLPSDAPVNSVFRFSYAYSHVWIFDADEREWLGYKIFR